MERYQIEQVLADAGACYRICLAHILVIALSTEYEKRTEDRYLQIDLFEYHQN